MRRWIEERIQNFPEFYTQKTHQKFVILQSASDLFFCNINVHPANHTIIPRQEENLFIKCDRVLDIWLSKSKSGVILGLALMRCPYENLGKYENLKKNERGKEMEKG